jgi:DNA-binding transcriptional MerR regulator
MSVAPPIQSTLAPEATYTIGELAKKLDVTARTLRYYEEQGLIQPTERTESKYRLYSEMAIKQVSAILALQDLGFSLSDIASLLARRDNAAENSTETRQNTLAITQAQLNRQREALSQKLSLLLNLQQQLDSRVDDINQYCSPCTQQQPNNPCDTDCQHYHLHEG